MARSMALILYSLGSPVFNQVTFELGTWGQDFSLNDYLSLIALVHCTLNRIQGLVAHCIFLHSMMFILILPFKLFISVCPIVFLVEFL